MNIIEAVSEARHKMLNQNLRVSQVNLSVDQGFELLELMVQPYRWYSDKERDEMIDILATRDVDGLVSHFSDTMLFGLPIKVHRLVE